MDAVTYEYTVTKCVTVFNAIWCMQGEGAWEPKSGGRGALLVAHGTHQNQYTKRRALQNGNTTSSNNDSDDNVGSSEDNRDHQHGHCADTGFTAEASAPASRLGKQDNAAQDPSSSQAKAEGTQAVGESGVLTKSDRSQSSGPRAGQRAGRHGSSEDSNRGRKRNVDPQGAAAHSSKHADASSGDEAAPMDTSDTGRTNQKAAPSAVVKDGLEGKSGVARLTHTIAGEEAERKAQSSKAAGDMGGAARTDRRARNIKSSAVIEAAANTARDSALMDESRVKAVSRAADEAQTSSADENMALGSNAPNATANQSGKATKMSKSSAVAVKADPVTVKDKAAESLGRLGILVILLFML